MRPPPCHNPKPAAPLSDRVKITVLNADGLPFLQTEGREYAGMKRAGDKFVLEIKSVSGVTVQVLFDYDALADHRDRINGMLA